MNSNEPTLNLSLLEPCLGACLRPYLINFALDRTKKAGCVTGVDHSKGFAPLLYVALHGEQPENVLANSLEDLKKKTGRGI